MTVLETDGDQVRRIEFEAAPTRFARGWHCIGLERSFRDGKPHSVTAFGKKLAVFEDSSGGLKVLDAYCRHMGGDLSQGTIKGDDFAKAFFSIWLGAKPPNPELKAGLLGGACG